MQDFIQALKEVFSDPYSNSNIDHRDLEFQQQKAISINEITSNFVGKLGMGYTEPSWFNRLTCRQGKNKSDFKLMREAILKANKFQNIQICPTYLYLYWENKYNDEIVDVIVMDNLKGKKLLEEFSDDKLKKEISNELLLELELNREGLTKNILIRALKAKLIDVAGINATDLHGSNIFFDGKNLTIIDI